MDIEIVAVVNDLGSQGRYKRLLVDPTTLSTNGLSGPSEAYSTCAGHHITSVPNPQYNLRQIRLND